MRILSFNAEGLSKAKADLLANQHADVICLQETHLSIPPTIPGMHLAVHSPSATYGSAIFVRSQELVTNSQNASTDSTEILKISTPTLDILSVYKPPLADFVWPPELNLQGKASLIIGDFNSHSSTWGYHDTNSNGEKVEEWALNNNLGLLYNSKDKPTFHSARWKRGYNPDLAFVSADHLASFERHILDPIPKSQHCPVAIDLRPIIKHRESHHLPRFNFRKAKWESFTKELDQGIIDISATHISYQEFQDLVWKISKANIPRGCRKQYIPGLTSESKDTYDDYINHFEQDPFSEETALLGNKLSTQLEDERRERWIEVVNNTDLKHNSKKAWATIKKLNSEDQPPQRLGAVSPDQVAHQLLINGKPTKKAAHHTKESKIEMRHLLNNDEEDPELFTTEELEAAIKDLKTGKAAGLDGITTEQIKHFGPAAKSWLLALFNHCFQTRNLPKIWRKAKVVAILKPKKDPLLPKSYRPISLLCIAYKLYEKLLLTRIAPIVEDQLSKDQAGFRPGRSCCDQVLNLTQYIEDGFERKQVTGTVFVDLSAAYDTVNHRQLIIKAAKMLKSRRLIEALQSILSNRRFFVEMNGRKSRWRIQRNGLPQGSVLAPLLFNMYTNDMPDIPDIRRFIYADDLCLATQSHSFEEIEERLSNALQSFTTYYEKFSLNANPSKTQVCAFHLDNHQARRQLRITWNDTTLENTVNPVYLGVTLDRTLSFKQHAIKLKKKVAARNNIISKLATSKWGCDPITLRQSSLALCYSVAEYCAPVWARSCHASKVDPELNKACRIITGTLKATPLAALYRMAAIAPPNIRRNIAARREKQRTGDPRHPLHSYTGPRERLKSRKSFRTVVPLGRNIRDTRMEEWLSSIDEAGHPAVPLPTENLSFGHLDRKDWCTLNRARCRVGRTKASLHAWGFTDDPRCDCGLIQTMDHVLNQCPLGPTCTNDDLRDITENAKEWLLFWRDKL